MLACGLDPPGLTSATLIVKGWDSTDYGGFAAPTRPVLLRAPLSTSILPASLLFFFMLLEHILSYSYVEFKFSFSPSDSGKYSHDADRREIGIFVLWTGYRGLEADTGDMLEHYLVPKV